MEIWNGILMTICWKGRSLCRSEYVLTSYKHIKLKGDKTSVIIDLHNYFWISIIRFVDPNNSNYEAPYFYDQPWEACNWLVAII